MSSDSNTRSPAVKSGGNTERSPAYEVRRFSAARKYIVFAVILASWIGGVTLSYSLPRFSDELVWVYFGALVVLFFLFLGALFRARWKEVAIFLVIWSVVLLPFFGVRPPLQWLQIEAFRLHASPIEAYLSRCKLVVFFKNSVEQKVGVCERLPSAGDATVAIIYDTSGELALPVSQRTPEWTKAMGRFSPGEFFTKSEGYADHLFGNFYEVYVPLEMKDGAADEI